jgi:hypothetical protein
MFSYIYRNTAFHAKLTEYCIEMIAQIQEPLPSEFIYLIVSSPINVACIGGGPGSEAFGLQMFLRKFKVQHEQHYTLYDQTLWQRCWQSTRNTTKGYLISPSFNVLDVTDKNERNWIIADDTNIIVLQYFIAEVYRYKDKLLACLKKLFSCVEQDLFILVIDMDPVYVQFVQEVVNECGGEPGKIDTIGLFKVVNYLECLEKLEPHFSTLKEINPLNSPRNNADQNTTFCVCKIPAKKN